MNESNDVELITSAIAHMNSDHAHNLRDYARGLAGLAWAEQARIIALDRDGFTMHVEGAGHSTEAHIAFDAPWTDANALRRAMVMLAQQARAKL